MVRGGGESGRGIVESEVEMRMSIWKGVGEREGQSSKT
jgi:hypothetical protein